MFSVKFIKNINLSDNQLMNVCSIKSVFGDYPLESQLNWISNNILPNDVHILVYQDSSLIAYANIIETSMILNGGEIDTLGVGNVCVKTKSKGMGAFLMDEINNFLKLENKIGLLFCKENLIPFYHKAGWNMVNANVDGGIAMIYNSDKLMLEFKYNGRSF